MWVSVAWAALAPGGSGGEAEERTLFARPFVFSVSWVRIPGIWSTEAGGRSTLSDHLGLRISEIRIPHRLRIAGAISVQSLVQSFCVRSFLWTLVWCVVRTGAAAPPSPAYRLRMNLCIMAPPLVLLVTPHARLACNAMKGERSAATIGGNLSAVLGRRSVLARPSVSDLGPFRLAVHVNLDEHLRFKNLLSGWQGARSMRLVH